MKIEINFTNDECKTLLESHGYTIMTIMAWYESDVYMLSVTDVPKFEPKEVVVAIKNDVVEEFTSVKMHMLKDIESNLVSNVVGSLVKDFLLTNV